MPFTLQDDVRSVELRTNKQPIVYVVDDDLESRRALVSIVESMDLKPLCCRNAEEFLAGDIGETPCCLVTDLRMQGMSGLDLLRHLKASGQMIPTIIVTGYAETPIAVDAMHSGAVTFLEKTAPDRKICDAISHGVRLSQRLLARKAYRERVKEIWNSINADERQILQFVAQGKLNKEIAFQLGVAVRTIEDRRARLMAKVGAESVVDLIRFAVTIEDFDQFRSVNVRHDESESGPPAPHVFARSSHLSPVRHW